MTLSLISENGGLIHHTHGHRQFPVIRRISELYRDFTNPEVLFTLTFWGNLLTRSVIASAWVLQVTVLLCVVDQRKSKCYHDVPYVWISMRRAKVSWKHEGHVPRSQFPIASPQRGSLDIGILSSSLNALYILWLICRTSSDPSIHVEAQLGFWRGLFYNATFPRHNFPWKSRLLQL